MVFSVTRFPTPSFYLIGRTGAAGRVGARLVTGRTGAAGRADVASVVAKWRSSMAAIGMSMAAYAPFWIDSD
jgi:hypothetical protein